VRLNERGVGELVRLFEAGEATPGQAVDALYEAVESRGRELGAYLALLPRAEAVERVEAAPAGPLSGRPTRRLVVSRDTRGQPPEIGGFVAGETLPF